MPGRETQVTFRTQGAEDWAEQSEQKERRRKQRETKMERIFIFYLECVCFLKDFTLI